jgi:light-regulated signal transduction histidine kinase (bacteriophytochrome)
MDKEIAVLTERISSLEREIEEQSRRIAADNKEFEAFTYSISHDLRAPLRAISGFSAILVDEYGPKLDDEGKRIIGIVSANALAMERLIALILELSRVGRADLRPSRIDMGAMARAMFFETTTPDERDAISFTLEPLPEARGDPTLLRLVWGEYFSNAVKFSSRSERRAIVVTSAREGRQTMYRVEDTGAGFDMAYAGKLFMIFQRLHRVDEFDGSGVGLAIVKRIVERHEGAVGAEGRLGKGSTFWFSLPDSTDVAEEA